MDTFLMLVLSSFVATVTINNQVLASQFKLSDLPVLKKWEVPHERFAKHVGRRYKDLDNLDKKRSTYWEMKPEFTANELDWDENPAKIQLDYNYKHFLEDDEPYVIKKDEKKKRIEENSRKKSHIKSTLHFRSTIHGGHRLRKSLLDDSSNGIENRRFDEKELRLRRDTLSDILNKAQMNALQKLDRIDSKLKKLSGSKKEAIPIAKEVKRDVAKPSSVAMKQISPSLPQTKKSNIPSANMKQPNIPNTTKKRNDVPSTTKKSGVLGDEPGIQMKRSRINESLKQPESKLETHSINQKADIEHAVKQKSNIDLVPSNVARAVAMAMEQLKRDKMWGKVFVHVRPSGQLKVMVQETKRMEE